MAINVKKLKRVIQGNEPLKVLNSGDKKPSFRQNGYELTLDIANVDYLSISTEQTIENGERLIWKGIGSVLLGYDLTDTVIQSTSTGLFYRINGVSTVLFNGLVDWTVYNEVTVRRESGINYISILGIAEESVPEPEIFAWDKVNAFGTILGFFNCSVYSVESKGETFNFTESRGTTTTGSIGTVATINTSNAGGVQYLDSTVWNKKSFALGFDSANSEYLKTENISITKISDVQFKQKLDIDLAITLIGSILSFGVGGNYFFLAVNTANIISIDGRDDLGTNFYTTGSVINGTELIEFDGVKLYIDGVVDIDLSSFGELPFVTNSSFYLGKLAYQNSRYYTGLIHGFELQGETFDLTEGLGNQIYGSNGTIATINTSNAQGIERTNYGQWLKNGNVLKFESTNSDYLELDNDITLSGDWFLEMKVDSALESNVQAPLSYFIGGNFNTNVIQTYTQGRVLLVLSSESVNFNVNDTLPRTGLYTMRFVKTSLNIELFVNGISKGTKTIGSEDTLTIDTIGGHVTNRFYNGSIHYVDFNGEQFQFREGQGITTTGSLGTTVTINTSHADGVQYINKQVWNIDSNKYIDYE